MKHSLGMERKVRKGEEDRNVVENGKVREERGWSMGKKKE